MSKISNEYQTYNNITLKLMLQLLQFAFMCNLQANSCCNSEEYITLILNVRFVGLELLLYVASG